MTTTFDVRTLFGTSPISIQDRQRLYSALASGESITIASPRDNAPQKVNVQCRDLYERYGIDMENHSGGAGGTNKIYFSKDGRYVLRITYGETTFWSGVCKPRLTTNSPWGKETIQKYDEESRCQRYVIEMLITWYMQEVLQPKLAYTVFPTVLESGICMGSRFPRVFYIVERFGIPVDDFLKKNETMLATDAMFWVLLSGFIVGTMLNFTLLAKNQTRYLHFDLKFDNVLAKSIETGAQEVVVEWKGKSMRGDVAFRITDFGESSLYVVPKSSNIYMFRQRHQTQKFGPAPIGKSPCEFDRNVWFDEGFDYLRACDMPEYDLLFSLNILSDMIARSVRFDDMDAREAQVLSLVTQQVQNILNSYGPYRPGSMRPGIMQQVYTEALAQERMRWIPEQTGRLMDILFTAYEAIRGIRSEPKEQRVSPKPAPPNEVDLSGAELFNESSQFWRTLFHVFPKYQAQQQNYRDAERNKRLRAEAQNAFYDAVDKATTNHEVIDAAKNSVRMLLLPPVNMKQTVDDGTYPTFLQYFISDGKVFNKLHPDNEITGKHAVFTEYALLKEYTRHIKKTNNLSWLDDPQQLQRFLEFAYAATQSRFNKRTFGELTQLMEEWRTTQPLETAMYNNESLEHVLAKMDTAEKAVDTLQKVGQYIRDLVNK